MNKESSNETAKKASVTGTRNPSDGTLAVSSATGKSRQTNTPWAWNGRLAIVTVAILLSVVVASAVSYQYHSSQTATTLLQRAETAFEQQDYTNQAIWLSRYSLLRPDDLDATVRMARAADMAADQAKPEQLGRLLVNAQRQLGTAIARLGESDAVATADLRRRLIRRLLQTGEIQNVEAERQVILLQAARDDSEATRAIALALVGQVRAGMYTARLADAYDEQVDYWNWLASQKVGNVLARAIVQDNDDLELITAFLSSYVSSPELFARSDEKEEDSRKLATQVEEVLARLRSNQDSQSKLILYQYERSQGNDSEATSILRAAAQAASERLLDSSESDSDSVALSAGPPPIFWDYLVVQEGARRFAQQDSELAARWYDQLMSLNSKAISGPIVEQVYLDAGRLSAATEKQDQAIQIWQRGLQAVDSESLALLEAIAQMQGQLGADDDLTESLNRFGEAIEVASLALSRSDATLSSAARTARGRQIGRAKWKLGVLESIIPIREGQRMKAASMLATAANSSVDVAVGERISVARQLASLYGTEGLWDKAAQALARAIDLSPDDKQLRLLASDAWARAGNRRAAIEQRYAAGNAVSIVDQIAGAEAMFNHQLRLVPEERDFSDIRATINRIRKRLSAETETATEEIDSHVGRLSILEISLPKPGVSIEEHLNSSQVADAIAALSQRYADDQGVQTFAAERLASADRHDESVAALARLAVIVGESDSSLVIVQARIKAAGGDPIGAAQDLIEQAKLDIPNSGNLLGLAASFAARGNDTELAFQAMDKIPQGRRTLSTQFRLALMAKALPANSSLLIHDDAKLTPLELSIRLEDQLRQVEGLRGTYWRYLKVLRLIEKLRGDPNRIENDDPRLLEGQQLAREILAIRPYWGTAISLQGWLSAMAGNRSKAVEQLQAGLAAGDRRLETRQLLWQQLTLLNRWQEADDEVRRSSLATDVDLDRYGALRIDIALRQRDFARSLQLAELGVEQRPDDFMSYLVLCNTARLAARGSQSDEQRAQMLERATEAIQQANELAGKPEPSIYLARLQLALAQGDEAEVSEEISRIEASQLSEVVKLRLVGRTRANQGDYGAAIETLERAQKIDPSYESLVELAEVYRRMSRPDDEIGALRLAYQSRPNDAALANKLASSIVTRDGKEADWNEVSRLLSSGVGATSGNRLLHAILLASGGVSGGTQNGAFQGSEQQQLQAIEILRELIEDRNSRSDDAARVLASLIQDRLTDLSEADQNLRKQSTAEVRAIYESLLAGKSPQVADFVRYAVFLLEFGEQDEAKIADLQRRLQLINGGAVAALDLGIRIEMREDNVQAAAEFVQSWADSALDSGELPNDRVASITGAALLRIGLADQALVWLDQAYRDNPDTLGNYVTALVNNGKTQQSIEICQREFENHGDARSALLFVQSLVAARQPTTSSQHQKIINSALAKFDKNASLFDSAATLLMNQQSYAQAASLYQRALRIDPRRIRAWNNLAMVLSEIPNRQSEAIEPIERAIQLVGEVPELLDTKGVVLLRSGRPDEAEAVFEKAIRKSDDPRFQFHLIVTLLAQDREADARRRWNSQNLEQLGPDGLMPDEVETLKRLKQKYGSEDGSDKTL